MGYHSLGRPWEAFPNQAMFRKRFFFLWAVRRTQKFGEVRWLLPESELAQFLPSAMDEPVCTYYRYYLMNYGIVRALLGAPEEEEEEEEEEEKPRIHHSRLDQRYWEIEPNMNE